MATADKVYRNMAFSNLGPNLAVLASMVLELYHATLAYDKKLAGRAKTIASRITDLTDIERLLTHAGVDA